jgi:hypothetical protein
MRGPPVLVDEVVAGELVLLAVWSPLKVQGFTDATAALTEPEKSDSARAAKEKDEESMVKDQRN